VVVVVVGELAEVVVGVIEAVGVVVWVRVGWRSLRRVGVLR